VRLSNRSGIVHAAHEVLPAEFFSAMIHVDTIGLFSGFSRLMPECRSLNVVDMPSFRDTIELEKVLIIHCISICCAQELCLKNRTFTVLIKSARSDARWIP
jgi:hypothetical protein